MPARARASARSFSGWPAWALTHCHATRCGTMAASSRRHRSTFLTGPAARGAPALGLPVREPAGDAELEVGAVGVEADRDRAAERFERPDRRHQLHPVVGSRGLAALELPFGAAEAQHGAPAARARIAAAGAVGEDLDGALGHRISRGHRRPVRARPGGSAACARIRAGRAVSRAPLPGGSRGRRGGSGESATRCRGRGAAWREARPR